MDFGKRMIENYKGKGFTREEVSILPFIEDKGIYSISAYNYKKKLPAGYLFINNNRIVISGKSDLPENDRDINPDFIFSERYIGLDSISDNICETDYISGINMGKETTEFGDPRDYHNAEIRVDENGHEYYYDINMEGQ